MGAGQSQNSNPGEVVEKNNNKKVEEISVNELQNSILEKCRVIGTKYKDKFLNKSFCDKLCFIMENSLQNFDMEVLEGIKSNLEKKNVPKKIKILMSYDVHKDDRFIVEGLNEELNDYLANEKQIKFEKEYVRDLSEEEKLSYISNNILNELMDYRNQKGGSNNIPNNNQTNNSNRNQNNIPNTKLPISSQNNQNKNKSENINKLGKISQKLGEIMKGENTFFTEDNYDKDNEENNNNNILKNNIPEEIPRNNTTKEIPRNNTTKEIPKKKLINKEKNVKNKIKKLNKIQKKEEQNNNLSDIEAESNMNYELNNQNNNQNLTKKRICKKITEHYIVRINIIAAIISALPYKSKSGQIEGFCYNRYKTLSEGKFCLPPGGLDELDNLKKDELMKVVKDFINITNETECKKRGGYFKILNDLEKDSLETSDYLYNQKYREYYKKLKNSYLNDLNLLLEILNELQTNTKLNNNTITLLSKKTKDVLTGLYNNCQTNYINSYICLLKANYDKQKKDEINQTLLEMIS